MSLIRLENVTKGYAAPADVLDVPSYELAAGEQAALLGVSGRGKTTLLHVIAGITPADAGVVEVAGTDVATLSEAARDRHRAEHVGVVFQTHHLLPAFTARENVLLGLSFAGRKPEPDWVDHLLDRVGLSDRRGHKPEELSVGQRQRVAVARALANRPKIVLADEPTGALDPPTARQVLKLIRDLCTETDAGLLIVTHDHALAAELPRVEDLATLNRAATPDDADVEPRVDVR
jgi:putative ABC transport system ATP-binding protein